MRWRLPLQSARWLLSTQRKREDSRQCHLSSLGFQAGSFQASVISASFCMLPPRSHIHMGRFLFPCGITDGPVVHLAKGLLCIPQPRSYGFNSKNCAFQKGTGERCLTRARAEWDCLKVMVWGSHGGHPLNSCQAWEPCQVPDMEGLQLRLEFRRGSSGRARRGSWGTERGADRCGVANPPSAGGRFLCVSGVCTSTFFLAHSDPSHGTTANSCEGCATLLHTHWPVLPDSAIMAGDAILF